MTVVKVKICGLTRLEDVLDAIDLGADYLGFNFYEASSRYLDPQKAQVMFQDIPPNIPKVGVFVNEDIERVIDLAIKLPLDILQFHGDEKAEDLNSLGRPWFKAIRLKDEKSLQTIPDYHCDWILLDAYSSQNYGGTGELASWDLVKQAFSYDKKIILAGGLNEENVAEAVARVQPFMVDVASGVEIAPGIKDKKRMEMFIKRAKSSLLSL